MATSTTRYPYKLIGGSLCLDFVNTVSGRVASGRRVGGRDYADQVLDERLGSWDALVGWASRTKAVDRAHAGRLRARGSASPARAARMLDRAVQLRASLYRIFKAVAERWTPPADDTERLDREIAALRGDEVFVWKDGRPERVWRGDDELAYPLWRVVRSAEDLLLSARLDRVRQCPGDNCGWLFLDTSRGGRRRWCDMADCGNLAKVRRHRQRSRGAG